MSVASLTPARATWPEPQSDGLNPAVLLEVTRDSSADYDTGEKLEHYRTIPSLREYIIVSHPRRRITVHGRAEGGEWLTRVAITGGRLLVGSLGVELQVDQIYRSSAIK
jgi:Uma2 family endonuclease